MIKEILKPIVKEACKEACEDAYKRGAKDMVRELAFVFDIVRNKAREEGLADAGAIDIEELTKDEFDELSQGGLI